MRSKKALYSILSNFGLQMIVIIYGFIVPKIIISNFGSSVNGLISSITQFLGYIALLESGFGPVVKATLYNPISKRDKKEIVNILYSTESFFRKISLIFVFYIVFLSVVYPFIVGNQFDRLYTITLIIIISINIFAEYYFGMAYRLYLQADQKNYVISIIQIFTYLINIVLIIVMVKINCSVHVIKLVTAFIFILRPVFQNIYVKKKYNIDLNFGDKNYKLPNKWDGLSQHIAAVIHDNTDITILTLFSTLNEVSVYSVYYLVIKALKQLVLSFNNGIDASFGDMIAKKEYDNINKKFNLYEVIYFAIVTIIFTSALILVTPFISIYTYNVTDVNYIRPLFGYLLITSEYLWAIRLPYSSTTLAAGHFKETRTGAWVEAGLNIFISLLLVSKYGIIGVAIGTIIAMLVRTIEFIYHTNKFILKRNILFSIKKIILIIVDTFIILIISSHIYYFEYSSYLYWIINGFITVFISSLVVLISNIILYKNEMLLFVKTLERFFKRKSVK